MNNTQRAVWNAEHRFFIVDNGSEMLAFRYAAAAKNIARMSAIGNDKVRVFTWIQQGDKPTTYEAALGATVHGGPFSENDIIPRSIWDLESI